MPEKITVAIEGELDYDTCGGLLDAVRAAMSANPGAVNVNLDCAALTLCDSMGLSTLLQIRRLTDTVGARLLIHTRPDSLDRILRITGTYDYLISPPRQTAETAATHP